MMKNLVFFLSAGMLFLYLISGGCTIQIGGWSAHAKYEMTVDLTAPMAPGSELSAATHNGSITVTGADTTECKLTATIIAQATTDEAALELAEQVKVLLRPFGNSLNVKIDKPRLRSNQSVTVNLDATVPNRADLDLTTHNGPVDLTNLTGRFDATTHNGSVNAQQLSGDMKLRTHNGTITCSAISGDAKLRTHNGAVKAVYSQNAACVANVSIVTHNGNVKFTAPPDFSAAVKVSTHNGSIKTDLPIMVLGEVNRRQFAGKIGSGEGKLHLETHNGSIRIQDL